MLKDDPLVISVEGRHQKSDDCTFWSQTHEKGGKCAQQEQVETGTETAWAGGGLGQQAW